MKRFVLLIFTVLLIGIPSVVCQDPGSTAKSREAGQSQLCQQELMQSYLLKGTEFSNNRTMLLCPSIKKNCCTRHDIQRIYHFTSDVIPVQLTEYKQKINIMLYQLRDIHGQLVKERPTFLGTRARRNFCGRQFREILAFDFNQIYNDIQEEMIHIDHFIEEHSRKFFCLLCDANAHENIIIRDQRRSATFNIDYCQDMLKSNKDLLKLLNIEMVKYMETVQNVVDCVHYSRSFQLRFPRPDKVVLKNNMVSCMESLDGARFKVACMPVCNQIKFAQIVPLTNGDFDFLHEMVLVFNRFLRYKESGNIISMKLRGFFKRFRVPSTLTRTRRRNFRRNITDRPVKDPSKPRKLRDVSNKRRSLAAKKATRLSFLPALKGRPVKKVGIIADSGVAKIPELKRGRFLQERSTLPSGKPDAKMTPVPRVPAPHFERTLLEFYSEIEIPRTETPRQTVYRIKGSPIFFDRLDQSWVEDAGINYHTYTNLKFGMSRRTLYKLLYSYRKPEIPDTKLTMFLMDFTSDFFKKYVSMYNDEYSIMPNNYMSKFGGDEPMDDDRRRKLANKKRSKGRRGK